MTNPEKLQFGLTHPHVRRLAVYEFDLEDLCWLQSCISPGDGFQRDVQEAIDWMKAGEENDGR